MENGKEGLKMRDRLKYNLGLKLLSFLIAFLLWLIVVNIDDPIISKTYSNIPVTVEHAEILSEKQKTYQIVDDTQTVNVTVSAKRRVLSKIKQEDIIVTADIKELYLDSQIPLEVKISGYEGSYENAVTSPRNLQVKIEDNISKTCNITPIALGTVRDGYVLGKLNTQPENITINGPESQVKKISKVTAEVDIAGLSENTTLEANLFFYDANGEEIDQSRLGNNLGNFGVKVEAILYKTKMVPITVDVSHVQVADGYSISAVKLTPDEIEVAGPKEILDQFDMIQIPASELYGEDVSGKTDFTVDMTNYLPTEIQLADDHANNVVVSVLVEKDGTKNYELPVGSIAVKNLDEDLRLTYQDTNDLEVHVKGSSEVLSKLNINKAASIDLEEYTKAGTYTVPVKFELPEGCVLETEISVEIVLEEK